VKRRIQPQEYIDISSIESRGPTQELGLRGGFETTSKQKGTPSILEGTPFLIKTSG